MTILAHHQQPPNALDAEMARVSGQQLVYTVTDNGRSTVVLLSSDEYAALQKLRCACGGETTEEFKHVVAQFMQEHDAVLEGLA